ncbi:hypothetical protein EYV94_27520 [Puteibacter caeruleilacunae]|nr:hypothetical protein EYV94_27520 [Puteibacter caeruleilacunae]
MRGEKILQKVCAIVNNNRIEVSVNQENETVNFYGYNDSNVLLDILLDQQNKFVHDFESMLKNDKAAIEQLHHAEKREDIVDAIVKLDGKYKTHVNTLEGLKDQFNAYSSLISECTASQFTTAISITNEQGNVLTYNELNTSSQLLTKYYLHFFKYFLDSLNLLINVQISRLNEKINETKQVWMHDSEADMIELFNALYCLKAMVIVKNGVKLAEKHKEDFFDAICDEIHFHKFVFTTLLSYARNAKHPLKFMIKLMLVRFVTTGENATKVKPKAELEKDKSRNTILWNYWIKRLSKFMKSGYKIFKDHEIILHY